MKEKVKKLLGSRWFSMMVPLILLIAIFVLFVILTDGALLASRNLKNVYEQALITSIAAVAVSFIYTTSNIDISIGAIICVSCVFGGKVWQMTESVPVMLCVTALSGFLLMNLNGLLSSFLGIKPMVCAILMMTVYQSIASELMGAVILNIPFSAIKPVQDGPIRLIAMLLYFVLSIVVFHFTKLGRQLRFMGGNERCSRTVGFRKSRLMLLSYIIAGIGIGLASFCTLIRTGTVSTTAPATGTDVMLATVLGGMSIFGGHRSNCYAGIIGAFSVSLLNIGLLMVGVDNEIIQGIRGVIFILIVYLTSERSKTIPSRIDV